MSQSESSRASQAQDRSAHTYELSCTDCLFETTVEGDASDVYDVIDDHQEAYRRSTRNHFVNFEAVDLIDASAGTDDRESAN